jgi:hypothetical protein
VIGAVTPPLIALAHACRRDTKGVHSKLAVDFLLRGAAYPPPTTTDGEVEGDEPGEGAAMALLPGPRPPENTNLRYSGA